MTVAVPATIPVDAVAVPATVRRAAAAVAVPAMARRVAGPEGRRRSERSSERSERSGSERAEAPRAERAPRQRRRTRRVEGQPVEGESPRSVSRAAAPAAVPPSVPAPSAPVPRARVGYLQHPRRPPRPPAEPGDASAQPGLRSGTFDPQGPSLIVQADNLHYLRELPDGAFTVIYIDPPFNTGKKQTRRTLSSEASEKGDRTGFKGKSYSSTLQTLASYNDSFEDYWAFLAPRIEQAHRLLAQDGTLYLHLDWREVHYVKIMCDMIFGRENFINELIWAYDYGAKSTRRWPTKHGRHPRVREGPPQLLLQHRRGGP